MQQCGPNPVKAGILVGVGNGPGPREPARGTKLAYLAPAAGADAHPLGEGRGAGWARRGRFVSGISAPCRGRRGRLRAADRSRVPAVHMNELERQLPPCVVILGMHRSGTSLLAGSLEAAGLYLGEVKNESVYNRRGNKENESIRALNNALLKASGAAWNRPPPGQIRWRPADEERGRALIRPYLEVGRPWGFKDPRTIWLVEGWLRLLPNARMVGVFRHPSLVIRSIIARAKRRVIGEEEALATWCAYNAELIRLQGKYRFPIVHFGSVEAFDRDFVSPLTSFARSIGLAGSLDRFFDRRLVNQASPGPVPSPEAHRLHAQLLDVSRQGLAPDGANRSELPLRKRRPDEK